ncbi:PorV/PorQ family protein [bacterium]|nr:PorV/PorQ family protein [bacterium]
MMKKALLAGCLMIGCCPILAGGSGFPLMRMEPGARLTAMAGAFTAVPADPYGLNCNPASLSGMQERLASLTYTDYYLDLQMGWLGYCHPMTEIGTLSASILYLNYGEMQRTDILGGNLGSFSASDMMLTLGLARSFRENWAYGLTLKMARSQVAEFSSEALACDAGLILHVPGQLMHAGLAVRNLGTSLSKFDQIRENLPLTYRAGISKQLAHLPLVFNVDLIRYHHNAARTLMGFYWASGGEFTLSEHVKFRFGYHSRGSDQRLTEGNDRFSGASLGFSVRVRGLVFDYASVFSGPLKSVNHFTFSARI